MKMPFLLLKRLVGVTLAGMGFASVLMPQTSLAEPSETINVPSYDPQKNITDPFNTNNTNPFSNEDSSGFGVFDLIHRATLSAPTVNVQEQNQQLNDAAALFKTRQQQLLQQRQQQPNPLGFQQNQQLNDAAALFKKRQQQLLQPGFQTK